MASNQVSAEVYQHGMALDPECRRAQCNYCGKVVSGFFRLQCHLGGTGGNVAACLEAPLQVRDSFRSSCSTDVKGGHNVVTATQVSAISDTTPSKRSMNIDFGGGTDAKDEADAVNARNSGGASISGKRVHVDSVSRSSLDELIDSGNRASRLPFSNGDGVDLPASVMKQRIGAFFFENGIDFHAVESYSFQKMMEAAFSVSSRIVASHFPSVSELKGSVLSDEFNEIQKYVDNVRKSWSVTGCSIVLDSWTDIRGRNLINFIADCPFGPVYLRSADVSGMDGDVGAWQALIGSVVEEVGLQNVVQVISHTTSEFMDFLGRQLMDKHRSLFWTVSATHCISLMLEQIGAMESVKRVMDKSKVMTRFIYSFPSTRTLMRRCISGSDLVKSSKIKAAAPFLTLENILLEKSNLEGMFSSPEWTNSPLASRIEGKRVVNLVFDKGFWNAATVAVKASIPLVKAISLIHGDGRPNMGLIYETMDQIKETISEELDGKKSLYLPIWSIIDDIWNRILHSPLHAAGYFLNPSLHYTEDFHSDSEVAGGLLKTIVRMVEDQQGQDLVSRQLDVYRGCQGDFKRGVEGGRNNDGYPAAWWYHFGGHCPDLQKLAIKVLSQTCGGAESYGLKRDFVEELLLKGPDCLEQSALAYVHCNLQLKQTRTGRNFDIGADDIYLMDDWIRKEESARCCNGARARTGLDHVGGSSSRRYAGGGKRSGSGVGPKMEQ